MLNSGDEIAKLRTSIKAIQANIQDLKKKAQSTNKNSKKEIQAKIILLEKEKELLQSKISSLSKEDTKDETAEKNNVINLVSENCTVDQSSIDHLKPLQYKVLDVKKVLHFFLLIMIYVFLLLCWLINR